MLWNQALERAKEKYGLSGQPRKPPAANELWLKTAKIYCKANPDSEVCQQLADYKEAERKEKQSKHKAHKKHKLHKHKEVKVEVAAEKSGSGRACQELVMLRGPETAKSRSPPMFTSSPGNFVLTPSGELVKQRPATAPPSSFIYRSEPAAAAPTTALAWQNPLRALLAPWKESRQHAAGPAPIMDIVKGFVQNIGGPGMFIRDATNPGAYVWEFPKFTGKDNATALKNLNLSHKLRKEALLKFKTVTDDVFSDGKVAYVLDTTKSCIEKFAKVKVAAALDADSVSAVACIHVSENNSACRGFKLSTQTKQIALPVSVKHALSYIEHQNISHANEKGKWVGHDNVYREVLAGLFMSELVANKLSPHIAMVYGTAAIQKASTDLSSVFTGITSDGDAEDEPESIEVAEDVADDEVKADAAEASALRTVPGVCIVSEACQSSLAESLADMSTAMVRVVLLQVCQALIAARQHFGFFHNNLCPENVLLAAVPDNATFYYKINGGVRPVASHGISCRITGFRHCTSSVFDPLDMKALLASDYKFSTARTGSIEMHDMTALVKCMYKVSGIRPDVARYLAHIVTWMQKDSEMYGISARNSPNPSDTSALHRLFHFLAGQESQVIVTIPAGSDVYDTEGRIEERLVSSKKTLYGMYLNFSGADVATVPTPAAPDDEEEGESAVKVPPPKRNASPAAKTRYEFYINNKSHPVAGPQTKARIERDKPARELRRCNAIPSCAERRKAEEAARIQKLSRALQITDDLGGVVGDIRKRLTADAGAEVYKPRSAERRGFKVELCTPGGCKTFS